MTQQELVKVTMQTIKIECKTCHELLVENLSKLKYLNTTGLNLFKSETAAKPSSREVHNYNPQNAYTQSIEVKNAFRRSERRIQVG